MGGVTFATTLQVRSVYVSEVVIAPLPVPVSRSEDVPVPGLVMETGLGLTSTTNTSCSCGYDCGYYYIRGSTHNAFLIFEKAHLCNIDQHQSYDDLEP